MARSGCTPITLTSGRLSFTAVAIPAAQGAFPFLHLKRYLDEIVLIREQDIANAFCTLRDRAKIVGEPAGVVATAAFLAGKVDTSLTTVAVVTGGNLTAEMMQRLIEMAEVS